MRTSAMLGILTVASVVALLVGCKQTRPVPRYEPMLTLQANQPVKSTVFRPAWAGPQKARPAPRRGGG